MNKFDSLLLGKYVYRIFTLVYIIVLLKSYVQDEHFERKYIFIYFKIEVFNFVKYAQKLLVNDII